MTGPEPLRNDEALRRRLGAAVVETLKDEIPGLSAHVGEDCAQGDDPEAATYRRTGAHFRWVAFAFSPWRMWDLHVGVVVLDERVLSVGFHISERAAPAFLPALKEIGATIGAEAEHKPVAIEYQANLAPIEVARTDFATLVDTIAGLCRRMAPAAGRIAPPPPMRSV